MQANTGSGCGLIELVGLCMYTHLAMTDPYTVEAPEELVPQSHRSGEGGGEERKERRMTSKMAALAVPLLAGLLTLPFQFHRREEL